MVKHIVFWKLKKKAMGLPKEEVIEKIREKFKSIDERIPGVILLEIGANFDEKSEFDVCLYSLFEDSQALNNYQTHPLHLGVREFMSKIVQERASVDYVK